MMLQINDYVYELYKPANGEQHTLDIVFIHGLQVGDYSEAYWTTWTTDEKHVNCWPQTWLAQEFPTARILSVSYDAGAVRNHRQGRMDMPAIAESLVGCNH